VGVRLRVTQAEILARAKDLPGAAAKIDLALKAFPQPYWQVGLLRAKYQIYHDQKDWDNAEDTAEALVKLTAGTAVAAEALLDKARAQHEAGRKRPARDTLTALIATYKGPPFVSLAEVLKAQWN
jgi:uncharacterized protein HemY